MKKKLMGFLTGAFLLYCCLTAVLYLTQRSLMYFPGGEREDIGVLTKIVPQIIPVQSDEGIQFDSWYWSAKDDKPTIVFFHGNGQAYQYWVNKLMVYQAQGFGVFLTDYRGYGGVAGKPTEQGLYKDARAHLKALIKLTQLKSEDLIYYGESLGTGVATQMATELPPKAIIYESAYSSTSDVAKSRYWMFPVDLMMKDQFRSKDKVGQLKMPKIFIHAKKDMIIPMHFGRALYDISPEPKQWVVIEKSGHNDLYDHGAQLHINEFLSTLLQQ